MAKKSASRRHSAARHPQGTSKQPTLVRTPEASASNVATAEAETQAAVATMTEAAPTAAAPTSSTRCEASGKATGADKSSRDQACAQIHRHARGRLARGARPGDEERPRRTPHQRVKLRVCDP